MKRAQLTLLLLVVSLALKAQNPIPNPGFEIWTDDSTAANWISYFDTTIYIVPLQFKTACKTSDVHSGSYAIKLFPYHHVFSLFSIDRYIPGFATIGGIRFDVVNRMVNFVGGVPISVKPTKVIGWFKYLPIAGDSASVLVNMLKNDTIIGTGKFMTFSTTNTYTQFEAPINYTVNKTPDKINVVLVSSSLTITSLGSEFYVDDLDIVTSGGGIVALNALLPYNIYPNPTTGVINIELNTENTNVRIYNTAGEMVYNELAHSGLLSADLKCNSDGVYFVEIDNGFNKQIKKISLIK